MRVWKYGIITKYICDCCQLLSVCQLFAVKGSEKMNVAILGYGVVGSGVAKVLKENSGIITEKTGHDFKVTRILDIREFPLSEYRSIITKKFEDIANDVLKSVLEIY